MRPEPSDELLHALVDGELGPADAEPLLAQLQTDTMLRERVAQLRLQKDLVRHAYARLAPDEPAAPARRRRIPATAGWALALVGGMVIGWLAHGPGLVPGAARSSQASVLTTEHVVLHLSTGSAQAGAAALDRAEGLLGAAQSAGRPLSVEIVANSDGLDLLRQGVSAHAQRIARLHQAHPGLALVACGQTAQRLRDAGIEVRLLPGVTEASSALDQVVQRMRQGWDYVKI